MDNSEFLICTRCGSRIRREQRNCLKCGQLNFENADNDYMKKYEKKYNKGVNINRNSVVKNLSIYNNERPNEVIADNAGNIFVFMIVNIFLLLLLIFLFFLNGLFGTNSIFGKDSIVLLMISGIFYLEIYSFQLLFMKANKPWWYSFIVFGILFLFLIFINVLKIKLLIFIVIFLIFIISYNIGHEFGKNPWLCVIFAPVVLPSIAFSNTVSYKGVSYIVVGKKHNTFELLNKYNKIILFLNICLVLISLILLFFSFIL